MRFKGHWRQRGESFWIALCVNSESKREKLVWQP